MALAKTALAPAMWHHQAAMAAYESIAGINKISSRRRHQWQRNNGGKKIMAIMVAGGVISGNGGISSESWRKAAISYQRGSEIALAASAAYQHGGGGIRRHGVWHRASRIEKNHGVENEANQ
jgi:hypothetical protein